MAERLVKTAIIFYSTQPRPLHSYPFMVWLCPTSLFPAVDILSTSQAEAIHGLLVGMPDPARPVVQRFLIDIFIIGSRFYNRISKGQRGVR